LAAFGEAVRSGTSRWDLHGVDPGAGEDGVERGGEWPARSRTRNRKLVARSSRDVDASAHIVRYDAEQEVPDSGTAVQEEDEGEQHQQNDLYAVRGRSASFSAAPAAGFAAPRCM
jgi:hypothetical protein